MKALILVVCIFILAEILCLSTSPVIILIGDVNGNGQTTPEDGKLVLQFIIGLIPLTTTQRFAADVNGNGEVDAYDANLILQYTTGLYFPVER